MIALIAEAIVEDGKGPEFEAVVTNLIEQVEKNEPGTLTYHLVRSRKIRVATAFSKCVPTPMPSNISEQRGS